MVNYQPYVRARSGIDLRIEWLYFFGGWMKSFTGLCGIRFFDGFTMIADDNIYTCMRHLGHA